MQKNTFRAVFRELREVHRGDAVDGSWLAALRAESAWNSARHIGLYLPFGAEPPTEELFADAAARGARTYVPAWVPPASYETCVFPAPGAYAWCAYTAGEPLAAGPMHVPEPASHRWLRPEKLDVVCVPGLLFDARGTRLGHGGGHIDRLLAALRPDAVVYGLALPWQISPLPIPREAHDVPVAKVILPR